MSAHQAPSLYQSLLSGLDPLGEPDEPSNDWPSHPMSPFGAGIGAVVAGGSVGGTGSQALTIRTAANERDDRCCPPRDRSVGLLCTRHGASLVLPSDVV